MDIKKDAASSYDWISKKPKSEENIYYFKKPGSGQDQPKSYAGTPSWYDLKAKAQVWAREVVKLKNTKVPARLESKKAALINRAKTIKTALEKIFGTISGVSDMQLGIAPIVVGAAAISAAAVLISKWYYDNDALKRDMSSNVYNDLIKKGVSPSKAAEISSQVAGQSAGILDKAKQLAPWLIAGAVVWMFRDKIKKMVS